MVPGDLDKPYYNGFKRGWKKRIEDSEYRQLFTEPTFLLIPERAAVFEDWQRTENRRFVIILHRAKFRHNLQSSPLTVSGPLS